MVANEYDVLGRMVTRTDYDILGGVENHTRWYYDSTAPDGSSVANADRCGHEPEPAR